MADPALRLLCDLDGRRGQVEVVGQKQQTSIVIGIVESNAAKSVGVDFAKGRNCEKWRK